MQLTFIAIAPFLFQLVIGVQLSPDPKGLGRACITASHAKKLLDPNSIEIIPGQDEPLFCPSNKILQHFVEKKLSDAQLPSDPKGLGRACVTGSQANMFVESKLMEKAPGQDEPLLCLSKENSQRLLKN